MTTPTDKQAAVEAARRHIHDLECGATDYARAETDAERERARIQCNEARAALLAILAEPRPEGVCTGVPDSRCDYLMTCGHVCNKCGRVHDKRIPIAAAPSPTPAPTGDEAGSKVDRVCDCGHLESEHDVGSDAPCSRCSCINPVYTRPNASAEPRGWRMIETAPIEQFVAVFVPGSKDGSISSCVSIAKKGPSKQGEMMWWPVDGGWFSDGEPTHWMPLPHAITHADEGNKR